MEVEPRTEVAAGTRKQDRPRRAGLLDLFDLLAQGARMGGRYRISAGRNVERQAVDRFI
jgi:hypothetical protein